MAETTIVPFADLPACAASCGPLYDVNGACVPPNTAAAALEVYQQCFCADARLTAWSTTTAGPCDAACAGTPDALASVTGWYNGMCAAFAGTPTTNADGSTTTMTGTPTSTSRGGGGGGDWLSNHWQWVIFIVVMVVGIAGIWIGAAVWRRHYLRKRDRQYALGKHLARHTGSGQNPYSGRETPIRSGSMGAAGGFLTASTPNPGSGEVEKPKRKLFGRS